jgi:hypothetical protein
MKNFLRWVASFGFFGSIAGALFLFLDVSFIDHKWSYYHVIAFALISIAASGLYFIMHIEEISK